MKKTVITIKCFNTYSIYNENVKITYCLNKEEALESFNAIDGFCNMGDIIKIEEINLLDFWTRFKNFIQNNIKKYVK